MAHVGESHDCCYVKSDVTIADDALVARADCDVMLKYVPPSSLHTIKTIEVDLEEFG